MTGSGTEAPVLITKTEAARLLGVSRYTLYALLRRGLLREVRLANGMNARLRREDVVALTRSDP